MSLLIDKLNYLKKTEQLIFAALYDIGIPVSSGAAFREVPRIISNIKVQGILQITEGVKFSLSNFADLPQEMQVASGTHNVDQIFKNCKGPKAPAVYNYASIQSANEAFYGCKELLKLNIFPSLTHMDRMFQGCTELKRINYIDLANTISMTDAFKGCDNLSYLRIINIGKSRDLTNYDFLPLVSWGDGTEVDSRNSLQQSLVDSVFDRKSAGYPQATIELPEPVKQRLNQNVIPSLQAKGYQVF